MQMPGLRLNAQSFERHLARTFAVLHDKEPAATWDGFLDRLFAVDWSIACGCLDGDPAAWDALFAARTGRSDCLLVDALRGRAARLYPRDDERQESSVQEFWSRLIVHESDGRPVLARYDGQRPLVPWLIRVFQNDHISRLRSAGSTQALPDDDFHAPPPEPVARVRWHELFRQAAGEALAELSQRELLVLGLRWRFRLSQREVAKLLGQHEGTISRQIDRLRDHLLERVGQRLTAEGWDGDDLSELVRTEMGPLLLDEPRLSADELGRVLRSLGRAVPDLNSD